MQPVGPEQSERVGREGVGKADGHRIMRGPADSGKESAFHPRCGGKPRRVLQRGVRWRPQGAIGGPSRLKGVCAGVHP